MSATLATGTTLSDEGAGRHAGDAHQRRGQGGEPTDALQSALAGGAQAQGWGGRGGEGGQRGGDLEWVVVVDGGVVGGQLDQAGDGAVGGTGGRQPGQADPHRVGNQQQGVVAAGVVGVLVGEDGL